MDNSKTMVLRSHTFGHATKCAFFCNISTHGLNLGVCAKYLPPYSPNLSSIKECFSKIKHFLHHNHDYYSQTTGDGILFDMYEVMDIITPINAAGYFWHTGYI